MDVIFDIDGTLADATHRLHFIKDTAYWKSPKDKPLSPPKPDWNTFLSDEMVAKDTPIGPIWRILDHLTMAFTVNKPGHDRFLFITGRNENTRDMTSDWLNRYARSHCTKPAVVEWAPLYMRSEDDRRPSHLTKRDLLHKARRDGYNPMLVFEDRKDDTAMWRSEGLLCCQVAEGDY